MKLFLLLLATLYSTVSFAQNGLFERYSVPKTSPVKEKIDPNKIYEFNDADIYPYYEEGMDEFYKLFRKKLWVPNSIRKKANLIRIIISFVVEKNGRITNIETDTNISLYSDIDVLEDEMKKAMAKMPDWVPGKVDGKPARVRVKLPYTLTIRQ